MTTATTTHVPVLGVLARAEIHHYTRSKLFWAGVVLLVGEVVIGFVDRGLSWSEGNGPSSANDMIVPAAVIGVFGLIIMAGLTKRSDRASAAAGAVAVPERTRTLALAAAVVVPLTAALVWFVLALVNYRVDPPAPYTVPFGPVDTGYVVTVMFALGVVPAVGGPILGLLIARWSPRRGTPVLAAVLLVLGTILLQGNVEATWHWRVVWPWTGWYGPFGFDTGSGHWSALPGSPYAWVVYLVALCALGVVIAAYHDPESDRARLRTMVAVTVAVAVVALVATMALGPHAAVHNPVVGPSS